MAQNASGCAADFINLSILWLFFGVVVVGGGTNSMPGPVFSTKGKKSLNLTKK